MAFLKQVVVRYVQIPGEFGQTKLAWNCIWEIPSDLSWEQILDGAKRNDWRVIDVGCRTERSFDANDLALIFDGKDAPLPGMRDQITKGETKLAGRWWRHRDGYTVHEDAYGNFKTMGEIKEKIPVA